MTAFERGCHVAEWKIDVKLGEGAFGAIYKVIGSDSINYAMKIEKADIPMSALKVEVYVLSSLQRKNAKHFCKIFDHGRVADFNYIVMSLVGQSLLDLRKTMGNLCDSEKQKFSMGCALSVGIKCVEAIEELHTLIFVLHRDIKPGNFAIGRDDKRKIYLIDFGMARRFVDENGQIRPPRYAAGFRGTLQYAPIACHISRELCRKDDLESWLYMQIEMTRGRLPWRGVNDIDEICRIKERCRVESTKLLFGGCPKEYVEILHYLDTLQYYDAPDYSKITNLLRKALECNNLSEYPYDWEI